MGAVLGNIRWELVVVLMRGWRVRGGTGCHRRHIDAARSWGSRCCGGAGRGSPSGGRAVVLCAMFGHVIDAFFMTVVAAIAAALPRFDDTPENVRTIVARRRRPVVVSFEPVRVRVHLITNNIAFIYLLCHVKPLLHIIILASHKTIWHSFHNNNSMDNRNVMN